MSVSLREDAALPLSEMNTTPLIDVLLVLLIMLIMTIPIATHEVPVSLPSECETCDPVPDQIRNKITIGSAGDIRWNGERISMAQLSALLHQTTLLEVEPELQFEPDANAAYDTAAKVLNTVESSGVTKFGFVGNERYRDFGRGD